MKEPFPRGLKDRPEQTQYNILSTIAKNKKIQFDGNNIMKNRSRSTMENYKTIQAPRNVRQALFDKTGASNKKKQLPELKFP